MNPERWTDDPHELYPDGVHPQERNKMTVFEKGTYLTVGELKDIIADHDDDLPLCGTADGSMPLIQVVPSLNTDGETVLLVLCLASLQDRVDVEFDN